MKHALRSLLRTPGFTIVAVLTLALGIGLNTAMFSMLNGFMLRPIALPESDRLFRLVAQSPQRPFGDHAYQNFQDTARASSDVAELAAVRFWGFTLTEPNQPADSPLSLRVTTNYFDVLRLRPALGRNFHPDEVVAGQNNVAIISHRYWQSRFHGDPDILGRVIHLDGTPIEIIGVLPVDHDTQRFMGPVSVFRPLGPSATEEASRTDTSHIVIGRYLDGVTLEQAATQFEGIGARLAADFPTENAHIRFVVRSLQSTTLMGAGRNMTYVLVGLSGFVLLIACANLANLLLTRAVARAREFSIRAALGASRLYLIRPLVLECLLLAAFGGLAAALVAAWTSDWLTSQFTSSGAVADFSTDYRVLAFAFLTCAVTAFLFTIAPAWFVSRVSLNDSLKSGSRGTTGTPAQNRFRQILIVAQFALALTLLAGAGFFVRGLERFIGANAGWNPDPVVSGSVNLASAKYSAAEPIIEFHRSFRERILAHPGVANASVSYGIPLFNPPATRRYVVSGRPTPAQGEEIVAFTNGASASYLDTMGIRLLRGRFFNDTDQLTSHPVVVINDTMARTLFPNIDPVGQQLSVAGDGPPQWTEIIGVIDDVRPLNMTPSPIQFQVYKPFPQEAWQFVSLSVRASNPALASTLVDSIRRIVSEIDHDQPVFNLMPVPQRIDSNFAVWKTITRLLAAFATLGLLLAALGIYGVISRIVSQRTAEIGVRIALGAQVRDILRLIVGGGIRLAVLGTAVGLAGVYYLDRFITRSLPVFGGADFTTTLIAGALLILVAVIACLLPALRATKIEPHRALRSE